MNFEFYRNFIAIAEEKSISRAAERLLIAQPALSAQLKAMENEYGARLVDVRRGVAHLSLTEAGKIFLREARNFVAMDSSLRREIADAAAGLAGTVKISLAPSRAPYFVKRFARTFLQKYPGIRFDIRESPHEQILEDVRRGLSEIACANAPLNNNEEFTVLFARREPIVAVMQRDSQWSNAWNDKTQIELSVLANVPLAIARDHEPFFSDAFKAAKISPPIIALTGSRSTAMQFAESKLAVALVPLEEVEGLPSDLVALPLAENYSFEKTVFKRHGYKLSTTAENFLAVYAATLDKLRLGP